MTKSRLEMNDERGKGDRHFVKVKSGIVNNQILLKSMEDIIGELTHAWLTLMHIRMEAGGAGMGKGPMKHKRRSRIELPQPNPTNQ